MSRYVKDENGNLILTAGGTRTWIVTQAAHDRAVSAGTAPNNCLVAITDDYSEAHSYSTNEVKLNDTWIDGKPIYRKVIEFGELPDTSIKSVEHGIANLRQVITLRGVARRTDGATNPLPNAVFGDSNDWQLWLKGNSVWVETRTATPNYNTTYIILEYTKTTD